MPSKMAWWYKARFGMFIHFGSYSYLGHGEWAFATENRTKANYQNQVTTSFNQVTFNPGEMVRLAINAGIFINKGIAEKSNPFILKGASIQQSLYA